MTAIILDGRAIGAVIKAELRADIEKYVHEQGRRPGLFIVRVGGDTASGVYSKAILRVAEEIGVKARLDQFPTRISADELRAILMQLNCDETVQGIIVQMPLPGHLSQKMVADMINSSKDIDGISPRSAGNLFLGLPSFLPATVAAVMEILDRIRAPLEGKRAVIVSRSNIVGKPLAMMLVQKNATVTVSHSHTVDLAGFTRQADVLVAAAGRANMITADMVRPGAIHACERNSWSHYANSWWCWSIDEYIIVKAMCACSLATGARWRAYIREGIAFLIRTSCNSEEI